MPRHTIILIQPTNKSSRTFYDFESVTRAMSAICEMYEKELSLNRTGGNIRYGVTDLHNFIDKFSDFSCLVFVAKIGGYVPHGKEWIKERILSYLQEIAQPNSRMK
ncbi:enhancer of rudimentary erh [Anaeramoeba ignava]|uniref:Enhancer of rudimentary erh n=1 Tax=Anaeramoeba ignava TaxID=1746090 RepID=A0A9Q0R5Z4_ANAIG|nr:enhancer of rudimentary erh [Anaeramoeba ignava]|eukprot:Anaeramoba_ignava/a96574_59.p1 GENE.a96574_59~~a96574_59.p1  ORF type:complete len:106 (-),score=29.48 a96574_59:50-367(-)